jgi:acyl-CoA hydrolase
MKWQKIYKNRLTTPEEAEKLVKSGDRIVSRTLQASRNC